MIRIYVFIFIYQGHRKHPERYLFKKKVPFWTWTDFSRSGPEILFLTYPGCFVSKVFGFCWSHIVLQCILSLCCFWCVWKPARRFLLSFFMIFYKRKGPEWWLWSFKYLVLERAKCLMIIADHLLLVGSGRAVMAVSLRKSLLIKLLVFSALLPWWQ